jgi:hypothetical protein
MLQLQRTFSVNPLKSKGYAIWFNIIMIMRSLSEWSRAANYSLPTSDTRCTIFFCSPMAG